MSAYLKSLSFEKRSRYVEKLRAIGFTDPETDDPYLSWERPTVSIILRDTKWVDNPSSWPAVEYGDIYCYFVDTPGPFTRDNMRAYRSLDAYSFYIDGWVQTCEHNSSGSGYTVIKAKVLRSQGVSQDAHKAWVAIRESDHSIECGHCTCMAGLGEVCSHVAAILFKVELSVRLRQQTSCTSLPCQWNQTYVKKLEPAPLADINFAKPSRLKKASSHTCTYKSNTVHSDPMIDDPTALLKDLRKCAPDAVVFTVIDPKKSNIKPENLPVNLFTLYNKNYATFSSHQIEIACNDTLSKITCISSVSHEQNVELERVTRKQAKSGLWHTYRAGRVTSSNFYAAMHTSPENPSPSLLKRIVYGTNVSTTATQWGTDHEDVAMKQYVEFSSKSHNNISFSKAGFVVSDSHPYLGTSPDGFVKCDCCGKGCVEIKCPFKYRDTAPCSVVDGSFCLTEHASNEYGLCDGALRYNHPYFYQVQGQMGICNLHYCDFVCFTPKGLHVERIYFDIDFFQLMIKKLSNFFSKCVLPEVLTHKLLCGTDEISTFVPESKKNKAE